MAVRAIVSHNRMCVVVKIMVLFFGTLNIRCRIILGIQKGTIILKTTHVGLALAARLKLARPLRGLFAMQVPLSLFVTENSHAGDRRPASPARCS